MELIDLQICETAARHISATMKTLHIACAVHCCHACDQRVLYHLHNIIYTYEQLQQLLLADKTQRSESMHTELSVTPAHCVHSHNSYLHGRWCMGCDLLVHPVCNAWEHGGTTRQHNVAVQVLPDVHITLHDGIEGSVINALSFHAHQAGCEQHLRAPEPFTADGDDLQQKKPILIQQHLAVLIYLSHRVCKQG